MKWFYLYLVMINIFGVAIMAGDKKRARSGAWRIPENNMMLVALAGGSAGIYLGLRLFRHKTRHLKFAFIVPVILSIQIVAVLWLVWKQVSA